jgi:hypothetical protein
MAALTHFYQFYHFTIRQDWADNLRRLHEQYGKFETNVWPRTPILHHLECR